MAVGLTDQLGLCTTAWVCVKYALLVSEDDKYVSINEIGDETCKSIVIAKTDFISNNSVILVNDRNYFNIVAISGRVFSSCT